MFLRTKAKMFFAFLRPCQNGGSTLGSCVYGPQDISLNPLFTGCDHGCGIDFFLVCSVQDLTLLGMEFHEPVSLPHLYIDRSSRSYMASAVHPMFL
jgi:hypothetical protein